MNPQAIEKKSYWVKHVEAFQRSKFASKAAYCAKTGINYHKFLYWYCKLIKELANKDNLLREALFMPIKITAQNPPAVSIPSLLCTLEFKQGHKLNIHNESVLEKLVNLLNK